MGENLIGFLPAAGGTDWARWIVIGAHDDQVG
jgi:hypothetical protein